MSRIFSDIKEDSLKMAIERSHQAIQSQVAAKEFYSTEKEILKTVFDEIERYSQTVIPQELSSNSKILEKTSKNHNKSSVLSR